MTTSRYPKFKIHSPFKPRGDQPQAITKICENLQHGVAEQVLLGVTGSGKTFTMAHIIERTQRPALILAPNKTLAAQLFHEFREFFPENAVEYMISYYDYYQPEAYNVQSDLYIAKSAVINDDIDKMRHSTTRSLFERRDVIVVSSVSCIYGMGKPDNYRQNRITLQCGDRYNIDDLRQILRSRSYRLSGELVRGAFVIEGSIVSVQPSWESKRYYRLTCENDQLVKIEYVSGETTENLFSFILYPASHYLADSQDLEQIIQEIEEDARIEVKNFERQGLFVEAKRLEERVKNDLEQIREIGYCQGVENYSRYFERRAPGEPPATLLDYFPKDFLVFIDESHIMIPQIAGMFHGDRKRKENLVRYGFRLKAALDNRPLSFEEFKNSVGQVIYISATPGQYELKQTQGEIVEQVIRPTGLLDPEIIIAPATGQIDHLVKEINTSIRQKARVLVCCLTKKSAEHLANYLNDMGYRAKYIHCDVNAIERTDLIRDLRIGLYDILIGINLLREGLDIPEVNLVAILDADKEGFLRSERSLIQMIGRAARHAQGRAVLYADRMTRSLTLAVEESRRRREKQMRYNREIGFTPQNIIKPIPDTLKKIYKLGSDERHDLLSDLEKNFGKDLLDNPNRAHNILHQLKKRLQDAVNNLRFEDASQIRDQVTILNNFILKNQINLDT